MKPWLLSLLLLAFATQCFGSVAITTTKLPNGTAGTEYSAVVRASGGCTPYKWAIVLGNRPAGITALRSSTTTSLHLTGTPKTAGTYSFTEQITDCGSSSSKRSYEIVIQAAANHVVDLRWKASTSSDVVGYNIYRASDGVTWKKINTSLIASTLYGDSTVADSSKYYYAATAVDVNGNESRKTAAVKATVP